MQKACAAAVLLWWFTFGAVGTDKQWTEGGFDTEEMCLRARGGLWRVNDNGVIRIPILIKDCHEA